MPRKFLALLMAALLCAAVALADVGSRPAPEGFPEGDIGFGLRFFKTLAEVEAGVPGFVSQPTDIQTAFANGDCQLMGRNARVTYGNDSESPEAVCALVFFEVASEEAESVFEQACAALTPIWGDDPEEGVLCADGVDPKTVTLASLAAFQVEGAYQRSWDGARYYACLSLYQSQTPGQLAVMAQLLDRWGLRDEGAPLPEPQPAPDGQIGFGLKFYESADQLLLDIPDFSVVERGERLLGACQLLDREAVVLYDFQTPDEVRRALVVFEVDEQTVEAVFSQALDSLRAVWGVGDRLLYTDDERELKSFLDVVDGGVTDQPYRRGWITDRYEVTLELYAKEGGFDIVVHLSDWQPDPATVGHTD